MALVIDWAPADVATPAGSDLSAVHQRPPSAEGPVARAPRRPERRPPRASKLSGRFRFLWTARWLSSIGDGLVFVAFPLLALRLTHNPLLIAGVAFVTRLPWLLFALPAGAIADRVSRRALLGGVEVSRMLIVALLGVAIVTHHVVLVELYAGAFLIASFETLFNSASMAIVPQVVRDGDLVRANSRLQVAELSGEQFIGPAIGGVLFAAAAALPVLADGASFAASAALLLVALRPARRRRRFAHARSDGFVLSEPVQTDERTTLREDVKEGLRWLLHEPRLRLVCALIACFALSQSLGFGIIVLYCTRVLHLTRAGFGVFIAVAESGNVVGAWIAPWVHKRMGSGRTLVAVGLACGAAFIAVASTNSTVIAAGALAVEAVAFGVGYVASLALRQQTIPLALAGRVSSAMRSTIIGTGAIATLLGGALVAVANPRLPFAVGGVVQIVAAITIGAALARRLVEDHAGAPADGESDVHATRDRVREEQAVDLTDTIDLREQPVEVRSARPH